METRIRETQIGSLPGALMFLMALVFAAAAIYGMPLGARTQQVGLVVGCAAGLFVAGLLLRGLFTVNPNEAVVMQLFGRYAGTVRQEGWRWTNPFYSRRRISLRVRSFESEKLKVNDLDGNPIEIGAIVVWKVL